MSIDDEANALLKRWNAQQNAIQGLNPNQQFGDPDLGTDQSPHLFKEGKVPTSPDQTPKDPVNSVRPMDFKIKQSPPTMPRDGMSAHTVPGNPPNGAQRGDVCKQCGTMHPPIPDGKKCPLASVEAESDVLGGLDDATVNKYLVDLRNIVIAQISSKGIKDGKKFFQYATIELTKALEAYNE